MPLSGVVAVEVTSKTVDLGGWGDGRRVEKIRSGKCKSHHV